MIKPINKFPLLDRYEERFPAIIGNNNVIFAYDGDIYTNTKLPDHLLVHENTHLKQQEEIGADKWVELYLNNDNFRLNQEIEAYRNQLKAIKDGNLRIYWKIKSSKDLSSKFYGNIITYEEAYKLLC